MSESQMPQTDALYEHPRNVSGVETSWEDVVATHRKVLKSAVGLKVEGKRVSHPMDAVAFLAEFGKWVDETFPGANHLEKLNDEVKELNEAPSSAMEMADVFLSLAAHAHRNGVDLLRWARLKFLVCKKRKWGPPDERGVIRHESTIRGEEE